MDIKTYQAEFADSAINLDVRNMYQAYYLRLNDQSTTKGKLGWCEEDCTLHTLKVKNNSDAK